eukprot:1169947-Amphidinium_carterae.1
MPYGIGVAGVFTDPCRLSCSNASCATHTLQVCTTATTTATTCQKQTGKCLRIGLLLRLKPQLQSLWLGGYSFSAHLDSKDFGVCFGGGTARTRASALSLVVALCSELSIPTLPPVPNLLSVSGAQRGSIAMMRVVLLLCQVLNDF